jgi:hypothetical protein
LDGIWTISEKKQGNRGEIERRDAETPRKLRGKTLQKSIPWVFLGVSVSRRSSSAVPPSDDIILPKIKKLFFCAPRQVDSAE